MRAYHQLRSEREGSERHGRIRWGWAAALVLVLGIAAVPVWMPAQREPTRRERLRERRSERLLHLNVAKINDPNTRDAVGPHSKGDAVVRAEILLDRLHFSPGEIGDEYNSNLAEAVAAFQSASGLPALGSIDAATWDALNADQGSGRVQLKSPSKPPAQPNPAPKAPGDQPPNTLGQNPAPSRPPNVPPAIVSYVIALEDVNGHFTHMPRVTGPDAGEGLILREAHFRELNYSSPLELLAEKFHSSPELLVKLNRGKGFRRAGERIQVPNVETAPGKATASARSDQRATPRLLILTFTSPSVNSPRRSTGGRARGSILTRSSPRESRNGSKLEFARPPSDPSPRDAAATTRLAIQPSEAAATVQR